MKLVSREEQPCEHAEMVSVYALNALSAGEAPTVEAHIASCSQCRQDLDELRPIIDAFVAWPTDVLRPKASLQVRLAHRIAAETGGEPMLPQRQWIEPEWEQVAPGISCKILATDAEKQCVSMLVRLVPGGEYPPHTHAGVEELHLLDGELYIDDRKLYPGDYNRAEPGTGDKRVWSETGCACVLITSTRDQLLTAEAPSSAASDKPLVKFEVLPEGRAWLARHPRGFALKFSTRNAAVDYAREVAMNTSGSELVVYGSSGAVESRERFEAGE
jgi:anti-sigma factor ChrR (cupin superfamily)